MHIVYCRQIGLTGTNEHGYKLKKKNILNTPAQLLSTIAL